jgi:hypothetical protein
VIAGASSAVSRGVPVRLGGHPDIDQLRHVDSPLVLLAGGVFLVWILLAKPDEPVKPGRPAIPIISWCAPSCGRTASPGSCRAASARPRRAGAPSSGSGLPFYGGTYAGWVAMSDDGSRPAILLRGDEMHLFRSDAGEPWTETLISPKQVVFPVFDAAAKLSVFSGTASSRRP